jgi:hypothetical protein
MDESAMDQNIVSDRKEKNTGPDGLSTFQTSGDILNRMYFAPIYAGGSGGISGTWHPHKHQDRHPLSDGLNEHLQQEDPNQSKGSVEPLTDFTQFLSKVSRYLCAFTSWSCGDRRNIAMCWKEGKASHSVLISVVAIEADPWRLCKL